MTKQDAIEYLKKVTSHYRFDVAEEVLEALATLDDTFTDSTGKQWPNRETYEAYEVKRRGYKRDEWEHYSDWRVDWDRVHHELTIANRDTRTGDTHD